MGIIFYASTDAGSPQHTSRFLGPFFRWLFPKWPADWVDEACYIVRKFAHGYEYMILCLLSWRAFRGRPDRVGPAWKRATAWKAWGVATVYAASDEFHQWFVPGRHAAVQDVVIDSCGAATGIAALHLLGRWRRWW